MLFKNILVPFDLSSTSTRAFKIALDIAQKYESKITLITCVEGDAWHHKFYDARVDNMLLKKQSKVAKKYMEKLESQADKAEVDIKLQILKSVIHRITGFNHERSTTRCWGWPPLSNCSFYSSIYILKICVVSDVSLHEKLWDRETITEKLPISSKGRPKLIFILKWQCFPGPVTEPGSARFTLRKFPIRHQ